MAREGGKDKLNLMVETREDFEDVAVCNHPKVVKINLSCLNDQRKHQFNVFSHLQGKKV